jgi:predicted alpha-1,2-mannosidase
MRASKLGLATLAVIASVAIACGTDGSGPWVTGPTPANDAGPTNENDASTLPDATTPFDGGGIDGTTPDTGADAADAAPPPLVDLAQYVDPFIGTGPSGAQNAVGGGRGGSVFPGATVPFGMVQLSPDTPHGEPSGYGYPDTSITGFSMTHFSGAGCPNAGDLPFLPALAASATSLSFNHANESASPGYYSVTSNDGIRTELTATTRTGMARVTFPAGATGSIVLDATRTQTKSATTGDIQINGQRLTGFTTGGNFCGANNSYVMFFTIDVNRPWTAGTANGGKATLTFDASAPVILSIGVSYVGSAGATANLTAENTGFDFDGVRAKAKLAWNQRLNAIVVDAATNGSDAASPADEVRKFYTALYHAFLAPTVYSDADGQFRGFDNQIYKTDPGRTQYANYSGWDIYRSEIQLLAMLFPDVASDMIQSLVLDAKQCGTFPKWSQNNAECNVMVGDPGSIIVAAGYAFGATSFDTATALGIAKKVGLVAGTQCNGATELDGMNDYRGFGYLSSNVWAGASQTLEYTSRDFAVAQFARALGDTDHARVLMARTAAWKEELYTTASASTPNPLIETRQGSGAWLTPIDTPGQGNNTQYVEGNAEQYTWMIPYDPAGLFAELGGNAAVTARLDTFFTQLNAGLADPYFYMGNEPNFATPWMYDWAGAPWRTQDVVRRIADEAFKRGAGGLPGNDDLGATSSWFVWAALGLYPEIPGLGGLVVGSPMFPHAVVRLGNGKVLTIDGVNAPSRYVQSATLNGTATTSLWVPLSTFANDTTLRFTLGDSPSTWGGGVSDAPPSFGPGSFADFASALNDDGIGDDGTGTANFDGIGYSYSVQALAAAGVTNSVSHGGVTFTWPTTAATPLDEALAVGQTVAIQGTQAGGHLAWLGSATNGNASGTATVHCTDPTQDATFTLGMTDWTLLGGGGTAQFGNEIAVTSSYRNAGTQKQTINTYVFYASSPVPAGCTPVSVTLPGFVSQGRLHIFAVQAAP